MGEDAAVVPALLRGGRGTRMCRRSPRSEASGEAASMAGGHHHTSPYRIYPPPTMPLSRIRLAPRRRRGPPPKMDQNLNVSSAAADTTVFAVRDCARQHSPWPVSSQVVIDGSARPLCSGKTVRRYYFFVVPP